MQSTIVNRAVELLQNKDVDRVIGWRIGEFDYDLTPSVFTEVEDLKKNFIYNDFSSANLSKYLVKISKLEGKTLVFLKSCDTYSFNQLLKEHRISSDNIYAIGLPCEGKVDPNKVKALIGDGILSLESDGEVVTCKTLYGTKELKKEEVLLEKCMTCKSKKHVYYDELIGDEGEVVDSKRFDLVEKIENMSAQERFDFWRGELSRCIRCNACRNVCPACTCEKCVFDNVNSGVENKAASNSFEENMFHIIRAFHVAGRCTDCGECSRVCPQHIPLHLLNRKVIKDINEMYGEYQAGEDAETLPPMTSYTLGDVEPSIVKTRGEENNA